MNDILKFTALSFTFILFAFRVSFAQVNQEWAATYRALGAGSDFANSVAVDFSGNVYVTGKSKTEFLTIKYNASGAEQWVVRYGNGAANSIAVDESGNIYVTGTTTGTGTFGDFATIKYDSLGNVKWVATFDGQGSSSDEASSMYVDSMGNVYVTGLMRGVGTDQFFDYATVKYDSSGQQLWFARYNGPGNGRDFAYSIAVDAYENVYVTGESSGIGTMADFATVKYNSSGIEQWVRRYNGPGNSDDIGRSIRTDSFGNVYVTGSSAGSGTGADFATVKYDSVGEEQWIRRYNGSGNGSDEVVSIQLSSSRKIYVSGYSTGIGTGADITTISYDPSGQQQWVASFNGSGNGNDYAKSITTDSSGNIFVTGHSYGIGSSSDYTTVKYSTQGIQKWIQRYNGPDNDIDYGLSIISDKSGNVYVTGLSTGALTGSDYATIKYSASGIEEWVAKFISIHHEKTVPEAIAIDSSGNVYVTSYSIGPQSTDYATIKYNSSGQEQWVARYDGLGRRGDYARSIAIDALGNVYVTGNSEGNETGMDYTTIKYNSSGDSVWVKRYDSGDLGDYVGSMAVDAYGNVYITGSSATIKYNSFGDTVWVRRYSSYPLNYAIAVGVSGSVYVMRSTTGDTTDVDYTTIKYSSSGDLVWVRTYSGTGNSYDFASSMAVDVNENVFVTGRSEGETGWNYTTIKYNSSGDLVWVKRYDSPSVSGYSSIALDGSGYAYVAGRINDRNVTIKYDSQGTELWVARDDIGADAGAGNSLAVDALGNAYVIGFIPGEDNLATIKYDSNGKVMWIAEYLAPENSGSNARCVSADVSGNVYVAGLSGNDCVTIKYSQSAPSIKISIDLKMEGLYSPTSGTHSRRDTVIVYLANSVPPFNIVDSTISIIDSVTCSGIFEFSNAPTGVYYLVIKHFNSIETWSKSGGDHFTRDFSEDSYDFTISSNQAYGNNLKLKGDQYCIISGDIVQDGFIDGSDMLALDNSTYTFASGRFLPSDLNGDGFTDAADMQIAYNNNSREVIRP